VEGQAAPQQQEVAKQRSGATDSLREMITVSAEASKETPSIGDQLAENLIAQSLDLPPKAAKVRSDTELGGHSSLHCSKFSNDIQQSSSTASLKRVDP